MLLASSGARAIVVGTGHHRSNSCLPSVPAVDGTVRALARCLIDRCGLPDAGLRTVLDPDDPAMLDAEIRRSTREADAVFALFYIGHGVRSPSGELHLATRATVNVAEGRAASQALEYSAITDALTYCRAHTVLVVLDCCFSGWASVPPAGEGMLLASATAETVALAPDDRPYSLFTGELIGLLRDGDPDGPPQLTLGQAAGLLRRRLGRYHLPSVVRFSGAASSLVLAPNPAYQPPVRATHKSHDDAVGAEETCPYRGIASFGAEDERFFFGRGELTNHLVRAAAAQLFQSEPLIVAGTSGAGKSSLLGAGFLPAVRRGELGLPGSASWPLVTLVPGTSPMATLAARLANQVGRDADVMCEELTADPDRVDAIIWRRQSGPAGPGDTNAAEVRLVLVVDQFEQVFTHCKDEAERMAFVRTLNAVASVAVVVLGVRADFLGHCISFPELVPAVRSALIVGPMTTGQLRAAIVRPAQEVGLDVEPGLVEVLLRDLHADPADDSSARHNSGSLPLLSHALLVAWQYRSGRVITVNDYPKGGIDGAVAATAEAIYARLDDAGRGELQRVLLALVRVGDGTEVTRRRLQHHEITSTGIPSETTRAVLDALIAERLVTVSDKTIEITHDALLSAWPRLGDWINADRAGILVHQQLVEASDAWHRNTQDESLLYRGTRLEIARGWAAAHHHVGLSSHERAFLQASVRAEQRAQLARRRRFQLAVASIVVLMITLALAVWQWRTAASERRAADARGLLFQAESLREKQAGTSLLLGIAADTVNNNSEARASLVTTLMGNHYAGSISNQSGDVVFDPNDRNTLLTIRNHTPVLWNVTDPTTPRRIASLSGGHDTDVPVAAISRNGAIVATGAWDGVTVLWDVRDRHNPRQLGRMRGHTEPVFGLAFSPDASMLVSAGWDNKAILWDVTNPTSPRQLAPLTAHTGIVSGVAYSPDGTLVATASDDGTAMIWDVTHPSASHRLSTLTGHQGGVWSVAFDGRNMLVTGSVDRTAILWNITDPANPRRMATLSGHSSSVRAVAVSPNGTRIVTGSWDGTALLWDVTNPDSPLQLDRLAGHRGAVTSVGFSPDGERVVTGGTDNTVVLWNVINRSIPQRLTMLPKSNAPVPAVAFSPKRNTTMLTGNYDGTATLWDIGELTTPRPLATLSGHTDTVFDVAFEPRDGNLMATASWDGTAVLWDITEVTRPRRLSALVGHAGGVDGVAFSPTGHIMATSNHNGTVILWDISTPSDPRKLAILNGHQQGVRKVKFDPSGILLASASWDGTAILWDISNPQHARRLATLADHTGAVYGIAFNPAGDTVATSSDDRTTILWNVANPTKPQRLGTMAGQASSVYAVAFSPDGHMIATGGWDQTSILWDVTDHANPRRLVILAGHTKGVEGVSFSPNGHTLVTVGDDGVIILWNIAEIANIVAQPLERACAITGHGLSRQDWEVYAPGLSFQQTCAR